MQVLIAKSDTTVVFLSELGSERFNTLITALLDNTPYALKSFEAICLYFQFATS